MESPRQLSGKATCLFVKLIVAIENLLISYAFLESITFLEMTNTNCRLIMNCFLGEKMREGGQNSCSGNLGELHVTPS